jgi:hypothetical protein
VPPIKLRVKDDGGALKVQVSRPAAKETVTDGGLTATVTTVESRQSSLPQSEARALSRSLDAFFTALPGAAPVEALKALARRLLNALRRLGLSPADLGGLTPDAFAFTESRLRGGR